MAPMRDGGWWPPMAAVLLSAAILVGLAALAFGLARDLALGLLLILAASCAA